MVTNDATKAEQIATCTARYVIAAIMHSNRVAELQKWSKASLVWYYIENTTMPQDGHFTTNQIKNFQRGTLIDHIADYDVNLDGLREDLSDSYGIAVEALTPIIQLFDIAVGKGKQP